MLVDKDAFFLFDSFGRPYRFASEAEVSAKRVGAERAPGYGVRRGACPAGWEAVAAQADDRVAGRHAVLEGYHTDWRVGLLLINNAYDGVYGWYECMHRHYSPYDCAAENDPSYGLIPV